MAIIGSARFWPSHGNVERRVGYDCPRLPGAYRLQQFERGTVNHDASHLSKLTRIDQMKVDRRLHDVEELGCAWNSIELRLKIGQVLKLAPGFVEPSMENPLNGILTW